MLTCFHSLDVNASPWMARLGIGIGTIGLCLGCAGIFMTWFLRCSNKLENRNAMSRVLDDIFKTLLNGRPAKAVFSGKNTDHVIAQLALHALHLPRNIRLVNPQQLGDFSQLQPILVTPEQDQALPWGQSSAS